MSARMRELCWSFEYIETNADVCVYKGYEFRLVGVQI